MGAGGLLGLGDARQGRSRRGGGEEKNVTHEASLQADHFGGSGIL
jgi:hypothetical protein